MFRRRVYAIGLLLVVSAPCAYAQYAASPARDRPVQPGAPLALLLDVSYGTNNVISHALDRGIDASNEWLTYKPGVFGVRS